MADSSCFAEASVQARAPRARLAPVCLRSLRRHRSSTRSPQRATLEVSVSQRPKALPPRAPTHGVGARPLGFRLARHMHSRRRSCTRPMVVCFRLGVLGPSGSVLRRRPCTCWHNTIGICLQWTVPSATTRSGYYHQSASWATLSGLLRRAAAGEVSRVVGKDKISCSSMTRTSPPHAPPYSPTDACSRGEIGD